MCCSPVSQPIPTNDRMRPSPSNILAADTDVAKVDVPAIGSVVVTAAVRTGIPVSKRRPNRCANLTATGRAGACGGAWPRADPPPIARLGVTIADRYKHFSFTIA
jgi:hypothetical protein